MRGPCGPQKTLSGACSVVIRIPEPPVCLPFWLHYFVRLQTSKFFCKSGWGLITAHYPFHFIDSWPTPKKGTTRAIYSINMYEVDKAHRCKAILHIHGISCQLFQQLDIDISTWYNVTFFCVCSWLQCEKLNHCSWTSLSKLHHFLFYFHLTWCWYLAGWYNTE